MNRWQRVVRQCGVIGATIAIVGVVPPTGVPIAVCASAPIYERTEASMPSQYNLIKKVQSLLKGKGYDPGPVDGVNGSKTKAALIAYQRENGLVTDGTPNAETLRHLGVRM